MTLLKIKGNFRGLSGLSWAPYRNVAAAGSPASSQQLLLKTLSEQLPQIWKHEHTMWSELEVGNKRNRALKDLYRECSQSAATSRFSFMVQVRNRKRSVERGIKK